MGYSGFTQNPTDNPDASKPVIDQAADKTPEAIQAAVDFAEMVGHHRAGTTQQRNGYQGKPGEWWDDLTDQRTYRWHETRGWQLVGGTVPYVKTVRVADDDGDPYAANTLTGLLTLAIPNAPAGIYWWSFTMSISGAAAGKGETRVRTGPNTTLQGPIAADTPVAGFRLPVTMSGTYLHNGGDLSLEFVDYRTSAGRVHPHSFGAVHYVRPLN